MKRFFDIVSLLVLLALSACNMPANQPAESALILVTSDPNASATPTPFQPATPGPTSTPNIVSPTPPATADIRWWNDGDTRVNYHNPSNQQEFMLERLPIASCTNPTIVDRGFDQPMDIDGVMTLTIRGGDGAWSFYLIVDNVSASLLPPVWSTECMRLTVNGVAHEYVSVIPYGVTLEP